MGQNPLPNNGVQLIGLGTKMHTGIVDIGTNIPITMLTAAELQTSLGLFTTQDSLFNTARSTRLTESLAFQASMESLYGWLLSARKVLAVNLGEQWSTAWAQAGFINNSTAIPAKVQERLGLALNLVGFLTANPSYEAPTLNVTAARATTLRTAALTAQNTLSNAALALRSADQTWTTAYGELIALMRTLIKNLQGKLAADDPRWLAFGLQMPATNSTPGRPLNVTVQLDQNGLPLVQCGPVALATRYRCRTRIVGLEDDYRLAISSKEPIMTLPRVEAGKTIEVVIQAVNGNLQGVTSDPVQFTMLGAMPKPETTTPLITIPSGNGANGSNGHSSHRRAA